jgi:hypothetical protein
MKTAWNLDWDYKGWKKYVTKEFSYTQEDWNQTLTTVINQISAQIHMASDFSGADTVKIHSELLPIFESFLYLTKTDNGELFLANKYKIIVDNKLNKDRIYVYLENVPTDAVINDKRISISKKSPKLDKYKKLAEEDSSINLRIVSQRKLKGKIIVKNFNVEINDFELPKNNNKSFFQKLIDLFKSKLF